VQTSIAAACIAPLLDLVLCASAEEVDAPEFQRACYVVSDLCAIDPLMVGAEILRDDRYVRVWDAKSSALNVIGAKTPEELTTADAITVSCSQAFHAVYWAAGFSATCKIGGVDEMPWLGTLSTIAIHSIATDSWKESLALQILELIRKPDPAYHPRLLGGAWIALAHVLVGRPAVVMKLISEGWIDVGMDCLRQVSPSEWVSWKNPAGITAGGIIFNLGWVFSTVQLPDSVNKMKLMLDCGFIDAVFSLMREFELGGPDRVGETNSLAFCCGLSGIISLDLGSAEAAPIIQLLQGSRSSLHFIIDHPLYCIEAMGVVSSSYLAQICAAAFGREEDGGFVFSAAMVNDIVTILLELFSGVQGLGFNPVLAAHFLFAFEELCVSDLNKPLLLQSNSLLALLSETLLVDPEHMRQEQTDVVKSSIQTAAAGCCLQLGLTDGGRHCLGSNGTILDALHKVAGTGLTEEARVSARRALVAIQGITATPAPVEADAHIMVSYQWDVQSTIVRIVRSVQARGHLCWLDVDCMKGSTMDAMSEAVDNAEVLLYGVSLACEFRTSKLRVQQLFVSLLPDIDHWLRIRQRVRKLPS
jgi:hypothetical protein